MVPSSTKVPSGKRSTRDSSTAASPGSGSTEAAIPPGSSTVRSAWLGAVVRARRRFGEPSTGPPRPRNSSANAISRISEHDDAAAELAGGQRAEGLVGVFEPVAVGDQLVDAELARLVEAHQARQVLARARAAVARSAD